MKRFRLIILLMFVFPVLLISQSKIPKEQTEIRNGILFQKGSSAPYSGVVIEMVNDADLDLREETTYVGGIKNGGCKSWREVTNALYYEGNYKNGKKNGKWKTYSRNGTIQEEEYFNLSGERDGISTEWYEEGKVRSKTSYKNGKLQGKAEEFSTKGILQHMQLWDNGNLTASYELVVHVLPKADSSPADKAITRKELESLGELGFGHNEAGGYWGVNGLTVVYVWDVDDSSAKTINSIIDGKNKVMVKGIVMTWPDGSRIYDRTKPIFIFKKIEL